MESWTTLQMKNLSDDFPTHVFFPSKTNILVALVPCCHAKFHSKKYVLESPEMIWTTLLLLFPVTISWNKHWHISQKLQQIHSTSQNPAISSYYYPCYPWNPLDIEIFSCGCYPQPQRPTIARLQSSIRVEPDVPLESARRTWRFGPTWKTNGFVPKSAMNLKAHFEDIFKVFFTVKGYQLMGIILYDNIILY